MATKYDQRFYDTISDGSQSSAAVVVPLLNFTGDTVIDVGCGRGWWGAEFARNGADVLVADLCRLADVVVFSAAIPHQSGAGHVNCQWPTYWVDLFAAHAYGCIDEVRGQIWDDDRVEPWYRQNLLVFENGAPIVPVRDLVHPVIYGWGRR